MPHKDWMNFIPDGTQFRNLTLPGSHDAGIFLRGNSARVKCQDRDLMQQCYAGSRFFDLRAYKKGFRGGHMRFGHFFEPIGPMRGRAIAGSFGGSIDVELGNIRLFLEAEPSETVILRFSHIAHSAPVVAAAQAQLGNRLYRGNIANLATTQLGAVGDPNSLRGKAVACFDTKEFNTNSLMGIVPFQKYKDDGVGRNGLVTCGEYANKSDMNKVVNNQLDHFLAHQAHSRHDDHLLVVYWQQTGGNIEANTRGGVHTVLAGFCDAMASGGARPNVVLHDFVSPTTCKTIVDGFNGIVV
jgi:hypothetical protein